MKKLILLACLSAAFIVATSLGFSQVIDNVMDSHVHSIIGDGLKDGEDILRGSSGTIVGFTEHLDKVIAYGCDRYIKYIRTISFTGATLAVCGVEVTCGKAFSSHDVIVYGITSESLAELARQYQLGAFVDSENGLPCLRQIADRYNLVLIAAHPDSDTIPYDIEANSQYCDGFEMFDSKHLGFAPTRFLENSLSFYSRTDRVTVLAGSDYHFGFAGALPTRSLRETALTHVLLSGKMTEESAVEAIRQGQTYAASLREVRLKRGSVTPGGVWKRSDILSIAMTGIGKGDLIYPNTFVTASNGLRWSRRGFEPMFVGDELQLNIKFEQLQMPDAKSISIDFGGRALFSTIFVDEKPERKSSPQAPRSVQVAMDPECQPTPEVQAPPASPTSPQPQATSSVPTLSSFRHRFAGDGTYDYPKFELGYNEDGQGYLWVYIAQGFRPIVARVALKPNTNPYCEGKRYGDFPLVDPAWAGEITTNCTRVPIKLGPNAHALIGTDRGDGYVWVDIEGFEIRRPYSSRSEAYSRSMYGPALP